MFLAFSPFLLPLAAASPVLLPSEPGPVTLDMPTLVAGQLDIDLGRTVKHIVMGETPTNGLICQPTRASGTAWHLDANAVPADPCAAVLQLASDTPSAIYWLVPEEKKGVPRKLELRRVPTRGATEVPLCASGQVVGGGRDVPGACTIDPVSSYIPLTARVVRLDDQGKSAANGPRTVVADVGRYDSLRSEAWFARVGEQGSWARFHTGAAGAFQLVSDAKGARVIVDPAAITSLRSGVQTS